MDVLTVAAPEARAAGTRFPPGARLSRRAVAALVIALALGAGTRADSGWVVRRFDSRIAIQADGALAIDETIDTNFTATDRHGINRDIRWRFDYDEAHIREYPVELGRVADERGRAYQVKTMNEGALRRFRIGDPNRTITGPHTYRIAYRIGDALNAFADHDELYWNVIGTWTVPLESVTVQVAAPAGSIERVMCFQGFTGSHEPCTAQFTPALATFSATRPLRSDEQLTIVVGLRKGAVRVSGLRLVAKPRDITGWFTLTPALGGATVFGLLAAFGGLGTLWWRVGRDRQYVALTDEAPNAPDQPVPLFGGRPVAVELEPPDQLRPAQIGLLLDERADTLDVTATIVDLAVRGYLTITELPKAHWFSHQDWQLDRLDKDEAPLLPYERIVLSGLFDLHRSRKVSELKNKFYSDLAKARKSLYRDAVERGWFPANPNTVRTVTRVGGVVVIGLGIWLLVMLGRRWGFGLLGAPVVAAGVLVVLLARAMPRRTARGADLTRRALGFRRYIRTAETEQQAFAERANLFTEFLPYAIVFKAVEQWARAFKDIDLQQAAAGWYSGTSGFDARSFSSQLGSFSSSVSTTLSSTPGGSGGSGFSGGSSGGGGGGGGGSSW